MVVEIEAAEMEVKAAYEHKVQQLEGKSMQLVKGLKAQLDNEHALREAAEHRVSSLERELASRDAGVKICQTLPQ